MAEHRPELAGVRGVAIGVVAPNPPQNGKVPRAAARRALPRRSAPELPSTARAKKTATAKLASSKTRRQTAFAAVRPRFKVAAATGRNGTGTAYFGSGSWSGSGSESGRRGMRATTTPCGAADVRPWATASSPPGPLPTRDGRDCPGGAGPPMPHGRGGARGPGGGGRNSRDGLVPPRPDDTSPARSLDRGKRLSLESSFDAVLSPSLVGLGCPASLLERGKRLPLESSFDAVLSPSLVGLGCPR